MSEALGPQYERAAATLALMRTYLEAIVPDEAERTAALDALGQHPIAELAAMNPVQAEHCAEDAIAGVRGDRPQPTHSFICASRASALATIQARTVAARLAERGIATSILTVTTTGDRILDRPLDQLGDANVFVKEIELALRDGRADYAVHSCKDLPSDLAPDMHLAAISAREDPRDVFCSERYAMFDALPPGAIVGTSSPRRRAQLYALRSDVVYESIRGNVDTRLRKLREGEYDAIVLAMAGLERLQRRAAYTVPFDVARVVPAVGQGALAVETRADRADAAQALRAATNDAIAERCVACERAALRALRAGCSAPIGIYARYDAAETLVVDAAYEVQPGHVRRARAQAAAPDLEAAAELGQRLAAELLAAVGA